mgnify:CR=1 FL=1
METHKKNHTGLIIGLLLLLIVGCVPPSQQTAPAYAPTTAATCTTKECFILSANNCEDLTITLTEEAGVFKYSSSKDCTFTKTLISLDAKETQEMKNLLEEKSLTCRYEKGKFDQRWVTSLIFGTETCEGKLKDILVDMIAFL